MDFAPEPVLDAFTPPPMRSAPRAPVADDNGQTFGDHLDAVKEPPPERLAPPQQTEVKAEAPRVEAKAPANEDTADHDETIDPETALLGGPLPPAPPPMAAPIAVQIVASQPQAQQPQAPSADADLNLAPVSAPEAPPPVAAPPQDGVPAQAADQSASNTGKGEAAADALPQQQAQPTAPQAQTAQAPVAAPQIPLVQAAPVTNQPAPEVLQQAIAATTGPAPQAAAQTTNAPRVSKDGKQQVEAKAASTSGEIKSDAPANAKVVAPKAANEGGGVKAEAAPVLATQSNAPDSAQLTQTNTLATTTSHASSHVQHAAAETGAQRAAPVAAQVGREIVRKFSGGNTSFELRLDPADLGRVEVRMEVSRDNRVTAVITADNPQALTELARNARDLEQQLQSAGLQLSDNGLSFDLRQGAQGGENDGQREPNARGDNNAAAQQEQQAAPVARPIGYERWRGVRVDLMV
ncbi:MAG: flagellar hook-length control protein FliK [Alphaproteobacteria bacterium]|nr:flagellar hook-length control protein FliK [Alphaproteobacteria bacterium]